MPILRTPPSASLETRDGHIDKDVLLTNGYVESDSIGNQTVTKRPGLDAKTAALGAGNAMYLYGDRLYIWNATEPHGLIPQGVRAIRYLNGNIYCTFQTTGLYPYDFSFVYRGPSVLRLKQVFQEMTPTEIPVIGGSGGINVTPNGNLISAGTLRGISHPFDGDPVLFRSTNNGASWTSTPFVDGNWNLDGTVFNGELTSGSHSYIVSTDNGVTQSVRNTFSTPSGGSIFSFAHPLVYGPGTTIIAQKGFVSIDNGFTWSAIAFPSTVTFGLTGGSSPGIFFKGGKFFAIGKFNYAESVDGVSWTDLGLLPVGLVGDVLDNMKPIPDLSGSPVQDFEVRLMDGFRYIYRFFPDNTWEVVGDIELYINGLYPSFTATSPVAEYGIVKVNDVFMFLEVVEDAPYIFYSYDGLTYRSLKLERDYFDGFPINIGGV